MTSNILPERIDEEKLQNYINEIESILIRNKYNYIKVFSKELIEYFSYDAPTGDVTTLSDIIENQLLLLHEIVEISELKKRKLPLTIELFHDHYDELLEVHTIATEWEFFIAKESGKDEWIKKRVPLVEMWLKEDNISSSLRKRYRKILRDYS